MLGQNGAVAAEGRTVLFVSHNMAAIEYLCHRGLTLQDGRLTFSGAAKEAVDYYLHRVDSGERTYAHHVVDLSKARVDLSKFRPLLQRLELIHRRR